METGKQSSVGTKKVGSVGEPETQLFFYLALYYDLFIAQTGAMSFVSSAKVLYKATEPGHSKIY